MEFFHRRLHELVQHLPEGKNKFALGYTIKIDGCLPEVNPASLTASSAVLTQQGSLHGIGIAGSLT